MSDNKTIPDYQIRKILADFGTKLVKDFVLTRSEEVKELIEVSRKVKSISTIH